MSFYLTWQFLLCAIPAIVYGGWTLVVAAALTTRPLNSKLHWSIGTHLLHRLSNREDWTLLKRPSILATALVFIIALLPFINALVLVFQLCDTFEDLAAVRRAERQR